MSGKAVEKDENVGVANRCVGCEIVDSLWMCLSCGSVGCSRKQFLVNGAGHALAHFKATGHAVAVRLATITVDAAEVWSYATETWQADTGVTLTPLLQRHGIDRSTVVQSQPTLDKLSKFYNYMHNQQ